MDSFKKHYKLNQLIALGIVCLLIGGVIGFYIGIEVAITKVWNIAKNFVTIDKEAIRQALFQWSERIGDCYGNKTL